MIKQLPMWCAGFGLTGISFLLASIAPGQETAPTPQAASQAGVTVEEVIVTGSNIPTSEEVGPNPVDTYRWDDIVKLGVRTMTDLIQKLPAVAGASLNENNTNGGDGRAEINLRGILAKETLLCRTDVVLRRLALPAIRSI